MRTCVYIYIAMASLATVDDSGVSGPAPEAASGEGVTGEVEGGDGVEPSVAETSSTGEAKLEAFFKSYGFSGLGKAAATHWVKKAFEGNDKDLERVRPYLLTVLNGRRCTKPISVHQKGCPEIIPKLRATGRWETELFSFVQRLEGAFPDIKNELLSLRGLEASRTEHGFQPYRAPSWNSDRIAADGVGTVGHEGGNWNVYYLHLHNMDFAANRARCPKTMELLDSIERTYGHAFFSTLAPGTHITPHHGPTNKKLRVHLPLIVPEGDDYCRLRVGDDVIVAKEGICYIFDDSLKHEAFNDHPSQTRIVLIFDIWHPDLSDKEIKFLSFLRKAKMKLEKRICDRAQKMADAAKVEAKSDGGEDAYNENENFFHVIDAARVLHPSSKDLWGM